MTRGRVHTADNGALEAMGPAQGEQLAAWLAGHPWNAPIDGGPASRDDGHPPRVDLRGGLRITVLRPAPGRLTDLVPVWREEVELALNEGALGTAELGAVPATLEAYGPRTRPVDDRVDLEDLANERVARDTSRLNGSGIVLLVEWGGCILVLTGDAHGHDLVEGLAAVGEPGPVHPVLVEAPHHGSARNVTRPLFAAVDWPLWPFSTDRTQFRHPDPAAIARILTVGDPASGTLHFNVPSTYSAWWADEAWQRAGGYDVRDGNPADGLVLIFDEA